MSKSLWSFALVFAFMAVLSDNIAWGLFNKSLFVLSVTLGFGSVYAVTSIEDLLRRMHLLGFVASFSALGILFKYVTSQAGEIGRNRLTVGGMNANLIGSSAAPLFLLCLFLLLRQKKTWSRALYFSTAIVLLSIIMGTGSRGSFLMVASGSIFIMRPVLKKNMFMAATFILIPIIVYYIFTEALSSSESPTKGGFDRITSTEEGARSADNRAPVWHWAMKRFYWNPIYGVGWLHSGTGSVNVHSIYILVLAECGLIGAFFFVRFLIKLPTTFLSNLQVASTNDASYELIFFAGGMLTAHLLHGIVESSTLLGSTVNCIFFGFGVGILDRVLDFDTSNPNPVNKTNNLHPWAFQRQTENRFSKQGTHDEGAPSHP
jgi:hypothetical protein